MLFKGKWSGARSSYAGYDEYEPGLSVELNHVYKWSEQRCFGHARRTLVRSLCSRNGAQRSHPVLYSSSNHFIYIYISVALYVSISINITQTVTIRWIVIPIQGERNRHSFPHKIWRIRLYYTLNARSLLLFVCCSISDGAPGCKSDTIVRAAGRNH